jgi:hypothetical protein
MGTIAGEAAFEQGRERGACVNFTDADKIAAAVLYEGYMLYPYRATSTKNVQRWNFGTLYPQQYAEARRPAEPFRMVAECLLKANSNARVDVRARFLHLVRKCQVSSRNWDEGIERSCDLKGLRLSDLVSRPLQHRFSFNEFDTFLNQCPDADPAPKVLFGQLIIKVQMIRDGLFKLSLQLLNDTPIRNPATQPRDEAMLQSFVSAHALLGISGGEFISLLDTPEELRESARECNNVGVFPVLVGQAGQNSMMLCSPIILYDYPQIAPESAGDFFDSTEMDEMLALRVLTLTEEEKQEMRAGDDRARKILERTETLPQEFLAKAHGAIRGMRPVPENELEDFPLNGNWDPLAEKPAVESVRVAGIELRTGDRVRLWPRKKADIMDIALEGKIALIEAIEQDFEDNIQLAVVVDDDPGREFGMMRQPGHRFFFAPEEVEPYTSAEKRERV